MKFLSKILCRFHQFEFLYRIPPVSGLREGKIDLVQCMYCKDIKMIFKWFGWSIFKSIYIFYTSSSVEDWRPKIKKKLNRYIKIIKIWFSKKLCYFKRRPNDKDEWNTHFKSYSAPVANLHTQVKILLNSLGRFKLLS